MFITSYMVNLLHKPRMLCPIASIQSNSAATIFKIEIEIAIFSKIESELES